MSTNFVYSNISSDPFAISENNNYYYDYSSYNDNAKNPKTPFGSFVQQVTIRDKTIKEIDAGTQEGRNLSRLISSWEKARLIDVPRESKGQWRYFSIIDLIWFKIILELRNFGFPLERIKTTKEWLFYRNGDLKRPLMILEMYLFISLNGKNPVSLVVFSDGKAFLRLTHEVDVALEKNLLRRFIHFDLGDLLCDALQIKPAIYKSDSLRINVSHKEFQVINAIRSDELDSVEVKLKDGQISTLYANEIIKDLSENSVKNLLNQHDFQDITLSKRFGKIATVHRKKVTK